MENTETDKTKSYIGDGVYVSFKDGYGIWLTTEDGYAVTNAIYLEPDVWSKLQKYVGNIWKLKDQP